MVERISISAAEAAILTEGALDNDGFAHLRQPYNGVWVGDIKMFRSLEQRDLMQFVDYQEALSCQGSGASVPHHGCRTSRAGGADLPDCRCRDVLRIQRGLRQNERIHGRFLS